MEGEFEKLRFKNLRFCNLGFANWSFMVPVINGQRQQVCGCGGYRTGVAAKGWWWPTASGC